MRDICDPGIQGTAFSLKIKGLDRAPEATWQKDITHAQYYNVSFSITQTMSIKLKNNVALIILLILTVSLGFIVGSSNYQGLMGDVKWTDMASIAITFFGFCLAFYTYHQWLNDRKKEDSYISAKKYLAAIEQIQEVLNELLFHYEKMCPAPGVIVESESVSIQRIEHVNKVWHQLYQSKVLLINSKRELAFWNVELTDGFCKKHDELIKTLNDISVVSTCLNSQLHHMILLKSDNTQEVVREKQMFDESLGKVSNILHQRITMGFENVFKFK